MVYRLDVMATSVADAIHHAGGLICDRALAGWRVTVFAAEGQDTRALAILGADVGAGEPPAEPLSSRLESGPRTLAIAVDMMQLDRHVSGFLEGPLNDGGVDVLLWGNQLPHRLTELLEPVRHDLSAAARTFKAQAVLAAGLTDHCEEPEEFWTAAGVVEQKRLSSLCGRRAVVRTVIEAHTANDEDRAADHRAPG